MKILLALDGSANSNSALEKILSKNWTAGSKCLVVTVNEPWSSQFSVAQFSGLGTMAAKAHEALLGDLHDLLSDAVKELSNKFGASQVSSTLLEGNVKDRLLETANSWGTDLIVCGGPGSDGVNEAGSRGLTRGVVSQAPCSVLVVRAMPSTSVAKKAEKGLDPAIESRFLVAVNGSTNSQAVIDMIMQTTWPEQSVFQVLTVSEPIRVPAHARLFRASEIQELTEKAGQALKSKAHEYAEKVTRTLESKLGQEKVTFHVLEGNARSLILQIAQDWPADAILMGAEDENRTPGEFFFGSTADTVVEWANCTVQFARSKPKHETTG